MPNSQWFFSSGGGFPGLPSGGIVGLAAGYSTPTGFTDYNSSTSRLILGHTSANLTGGSSLVKSVTSGAGGYHTNTGGYAFIRNAGGSGSNALGPGVGGGSHNHTVHFYYTPPRNRVKLIKCDADDTEIPEGVLLLGVSSSLSDVDDGYDTFNNSGYYLEHYTSTTTGSESKSADAIANTFSHNHHPFPYNSTSPCGGYVSSYVGLASNSAGPNHDHGIGSVSISPSLQYVILKCFMRQIASKQVESGTIIMFDGGTIPEGWVLCDGSGGTVNTVGYFIKNGTASLGSYTSSNITSGSASLSNAGSHSHTYSTNGIGWVCNYMHSGSVSHGHSASYGSTGFTPVYRTLKFIQYTG